MSLVVAKLDSFLLSSDLPVFMLDLPDLNAFISSSFVSFLLFFPSFHVEFLTLYYQRSLVMLMMLLAPL